MKSEKIAVIGGGIMGMSLALELAEKGNHVSIFEASGELGGLVSPASFGDYKWDRFYHVILPADTLTQKLVKSLGLENKIRWKETKTGFFTDGQLYSMSNTLEFLQFPPLNLLDKIRLGLTILAGSRIKDYKRLENIPVSKWLTRWSGKKTFEKLWLPLLRAKLGDGYKRTSAVFIWATIRRLYGARKSSAKKELFGYIDGGYASVIEAFKNILQEKGVEINLNWKASLIQPENDGKVEIVSTEGNKIGFDKVVLTITSDIVARICRGLSYGEVEKLKCIEYLGVICVSILLKGKISPFYITNITDSWVPFTGVIEMTTLVDSECFGGLSLIYLPKYVSQDDPLMEAGNEEISTVFIESLIKMYPEITRERIVSVSVSRAPKVIALPVLKYSEKLINPKTSVKGVYIINSSLITDGTLNVNETLKVAEANVNYIFE